MLYKFSELRFVLKLIGVLHRNFNQVFAIKKLIDFLDPNNIRRKSSLRLSRKHQIFIDKHGGKYLLDTNQHIDYRFFMQGFFDEKVLLQLKEYGSNQEVFYIDVGANVGLVLIPCAILGYSSLAIEPIKEHLAKLKNNIKLNNNLNIFIEEFALVSERAITKCQSLTLYMPPGNSGATSSNSNWSPSKSKNDIHKVPITTLDSLIVKYENIINSKKLLIKIDVEGMELEVLEGALNTLASYEFMIVMEWKNVENFSLRSKKLQKFIEDNSLEVFALSMDSQSKTLIRIPFRVECAYEDIIITKA